MIKIDVKKPKIECKELGTNQAEFIIEPLERGFGTTLGNCLRRILLSTLPGVAPVGIKIEGASHEFAPLPGVKEDITDIILNIKNLAVEAATEDINYKQICKIEKHTPGVVTAKDIICPSDIEIKNPDAYICTLDDNAAIDMTITMGAGRGYVSASEHAKAAEDDYAREIGYISIDSIYTPVVTASYAVETARLGADMSYEKLTISVTTNGAVTPKEVISYAASYMSNQIGLFVNLSENMKDAIKLETQEDETQARNLETSIEELDLTCRSLNCCKRSNIKTIQQLTQKSEEDLMRLKNLGKKSVAEIIEKLAKLGYSLKSKEEI